MLPVTSRFSIKAPFLVTWREPLGVSLAPAGTPVLEALGFGPEQMDPPPVEVDSPELEVLAEPPARGNGHAFGEAGRGEGGGCENEEGEGTHGSISCQGARASLLGAGAGAEGESEGEGPRGDVLLGRGAVAGV